MTSVIPQIQQALRMVVGDFLSTKAQYHSMLSNAVTEPREYGPWLAITGVLAGGTARQDYDQQRGRYQTVSLISYRVRDSGPKLKQGDQVKLADGIIWNVVGIDSSGPGSIRYSLERVAGSIVAGGDRGAAV